MSYSSASHGQHKKTELLSEIRYGRKKEYIRHTAKIPAVFPISPHLK
jgi:hypothetical protein